MKKKKLEKIVKESFNITQVCEKIYSNRYYGNRQTIKKYITEYDIDVSHFTYRAKQNGRTKTFVKRELCDILLKNSTYTDSTLLKNRLYKEGLKIKKCELCGQEEEWHGKKIVHILDHINGVNNDNRIENLRIVCPNCNSTLKTQGGKNIKAYKLKKPLTKQEKTEIRKEAAIKQRKVERPSYDELKHEVNKHGFSATGRKYGVSDNAIRKWIKFYEKY